MHRRTLGSLLLATGLLAGTTAVPPASAVEEPRIEVGTTSLQMADGDHPAPVPAEIVGANHRWPDDGKGMWDPSSDTAVGGIDDLARRTGLASVRYPGGTVANFFDFTRAVGPQEQRGCQTSGGFANGLFAPTDSRYGPEEQETSVESVGATTMIMVPSMNRTAADAADYVEYMNSPADGSAGNPNGGTDWAEVRAANGHREPYGIEVWEYGNEPYLANQRYWRAQDLPTRVAQFIEGGWVRQTVDSAPYEDNDGLFSGCDLATRQQGDGEPDQAYRVRYAPIALPGDEVGAQGVGDGPVAAPVLRVAGQVWKLVDDLSAAGPDDAVYAVDQAAGEVRFGDGRHGRVPPAGAELSIEYTSGVHEGFLAYRDAMVEVDPTIEVCAGWGKVEFIEAMGSRPYDCLGVHSYTTPPADGSPLRYDSLQAGAATKSRELADFRRRLGTLFPEAEQRPELIVTEYGTLNAPFPQFGAMLAHNLYMADLLAGQLENDVRVAISSNLNGLGPDDPARRSYGELFGVSPEFVWTGRAQVLRLYSEMVGSTVVETTVTGPERGQPGRRYPTLRVVAACRGARSQVVVVNRDPDDAVVATVDLAGARGRQVVVASTLTGPSPSSYNTETDSPVRTSTTRHATAGPSFRHSFAPASVTLLEVTGAGRGACG